MTATLPAQQAKDRYRTLCANGARVPVFYQPWRWDALFGPKGWQIALWEENNRLCGAWPFTLESKALMGLWIRQPILTPYAGPLVLPPPDAALRTIGLRQYVRRVQQGLRVQLPAEVNLVDVAVYPDQTDAMLWAHWGCRLLTRYTYQLDLRSMDESALWAGLRENIRRCIRKAEKVVTVSQHETAAGLETLFHLLQGTFGRQGLGLPVGLDGLSRLDAAAVRHGARTIFLAQDTQGRHHAGLYLLHDTQSAYLHMAGENPTLRNSEASILLIWRAIQYAKHILKVPVFDFEGSMLPGVERVYAAFGGEQKPYIRIVRTQGWAVKLFYSLKGRL